MRRRGGGEGEEREEEERPSQNKKASRKKKNEEKGKTHHEIFFGAFFIHGARVWGGRIWVLGGGGGDGVHGSGNFRLVFSKRQRMYITFTQD